MDSDQAFFWTYLRPIAQGATTLVLAGPVVELVKAIPIYGMNQATFCRSDIATENSGPGVCKPKSWRYPAMRNEPHVELASTTAVTTNRFGSGLAVFPQV